MTGQELFRALSFVDERYIAEAETARLKSGIPWMKVLSVAACLCILLTGAFALENMGHKGTMESAPEAEAPAASMEAPEAAAPEEMTTVAGTPLMPEEVFTETAAGEPETIPGELHRVAFAHLRILKVLEDGSFQVFVEKVADEPGPFDAGVEMTLVIDPDMIPAADRTDLEYDGTVEEEMLVEIQNGTYDAGINTLYAEGVFAAARE